MINYKQLWEELYLKPEYKLKSPIETGSEIHQSLENFYTSLLKEKIHKICLKDQKKD